MAQTPKQKAFFASLKTTRFLCMDCKVLKMFKKYEGEGLVELECGHQRHISQIDAKVWKVDKVLQKLDRRR